MKVIKRDGRAVEYDRQKIAIAIGKANKEVVINERATQEEINSIMEYIESLGKKRMLVEDIQDIIEQKLMELKRYDLAKKYIVYRYTRQLVRKQNTTDESILGLIRNENNELKEQNSNNYLASKQRNYIAGEVSRDLTKRLLLPEKITKADENGILHFHNADYFIQPMINNSYINLKALLQDGVEINGYSIKKPKNFMEACQTLLDIILDVANNQYGVQNIDISCLGEYSKNETEEELTNSLQFLKQHLNTIMIAGKLVHIKFLISSEENKGIKEKIEQIELANNKNIFVEIIDENKTENRLGQFDQGKVSINLAQIALVSNGDSEAFYSELKERLEICKEALMCKHYALLGASSDISPILWQSGGIASLEKGEKIDSVLTNGISTLSLGYIGLEECANLIQLKDGTDIKDKIMQIMLEVTGEWTKETGIKFILDSRNAQKVAVKFLNIDKEKFGVIKNITDKIGYEI